MHQIRIWLSWLTDCQWHLWHLKHMQFWFWTILDHFGGGWTKTHFRNPSKFKEIAPRPESALIFPATPRLARVIAIYCSFRHIFTSRIGEVYLPLLDTGEYVALCNLCPLSATSTTVPEETTAAWAYRIQGPTPVEGLFQIWHERRGPGGTFFLRRKFSYFQSF